MTRYEVIVKTDPQDAPKEHEMSAAVLLAYHFKADITFLRPEHKKTPDIDGIKWEIKSPKGGSKKTIENNLRLARRQSKHIVIDLRRSKLHQARAIARIQFYLGTEAHNIKQLKIITKTRKIIDLL
ncbi:hypothetical protein KC947_03650 [Candidatus Saccharibacteria bacterium]|nr:hypothetical protein [Candidatus Saccharibacteria bacterium]